MIKNMACGKLVKIFKFLPTQNPTWAVNGIMQRSAKSTNQIRHFSQSCITLATVAVKTPNFPESITEGDIRWNVAVGETVKVDQTIGEVETDKTSLAIVSPVHGVIKELTVGDGSKVKKGQVVCSVEESDQRQQVAKQTEAPVSTAKSNQTVPPPRQEKPKVESQKTTKTDPIAPTNEERIETRLPMNRMRQTIAQRLKDAQNVNAMLTTFNEIDMSSAIAMRSRFKDKVLKEHGIKLGFMSLFIQAAVNALDKQPIVNSVIVGNEILSRNFIDISVAVSSPKGLVVPVIRNVHRMNILQIEQKMVELADRARNNKLAMEDMEGGTFTISNGGVFGSMLSTPIINMPQSAILGMHATKDRPVAIDGKVEIRPIMYVALTYDHRIIDGREAVTFLKRIKECIEDPAIILLGF